MNEKIGYTPLQLGVVTVRGKDAIKFLQGQATQDLANLPLNQAIAAAFCTAKGRTVSNVWLVNITADEPTIHMLCHPSSAPLLVKHLQKYIAFFRGTTIQDQTEQFACYGLYCDEVDSNIVTLAQNARNFYAQIKGSRTLVFIDKESEQTIEASLQLANNTRASKEQWAKKDIEVQMLWLDAQQVEQWIPQNFSLDLLDGISFKKGCYTGQEVIARLHYKGQSKKRLFSIQCECPQTHTGTKIYSLTGAIGDIIQTTWLDGTMYALAIINVAASSGAMFADENQQYPLQLLN